MWYNRLGPNCFVQIQIKHTLYKPLPYYWMLSSLDKMVNPDMIENAIYTKS